MASETPRTISRGQISFVDLSDGKTMNFYLTANKPLVQIFNLDDSTFNPDYETVGDNLVITPELYISGSVANQMTVSVPHAVVSDVHYILNDTVDLYNAAGHTHDDGLGATYDPNNGHILTIAKNIAGAFLKIECHCKYTDPETTAQTVAKSYITVTRMDTTGNTIIAVMTYPLGTTIKNNEPSYVLLRADLWRGSAIDETNVRYKWYRRDNRSGDGADLNNWYEITHEHAYGITGKQISVADWQAGNYNVNTFTDDSFNVNTIKVPADSVDNYDVFKCEIEDTDSASGTYQQKVYDTVTVIDQTDPFQIQFTTSNGNMFKDGVESSQVTADVWQNGRLLDTFPNSWLFAWTKRDRTGAVDNNWYPYPAAGTSQPRMNSRSGPAATHRIITISREDVTVSALFSLEISIPQANNE